MKRNHTIKNEDIITIKTSNKALILILYGLQRNESIPTIIAGYADR
jgi:hypothetical protein